MSKLNVRNKTKSTLLDASFNSDAKYRSIQNLTQILIEKTSIKDVAQEIVQKAIFNLGFDDCSIYLLQQKKLKLISFHTTNQDFQSKLESIDSIDLTNGQIGEVATEGLPKIAKIYSPNRNCIFGDVCFNSQITVPIIYNKEVIGVIDSKHIDENHFNQNHLETLETIANIASVKIVQIKKNKELELYKNELEQLVSKRTKDLEEILDELKNKNKEINLKNQSLNILLQEVHHRVANNLQIILSLIRIKYVNSDKPVDPNQFKDLENRILSMSLVHQNIMNKGYISKDDLGAYLSDLLRHIQRSTNFTRGINLVKNIDSFSINPNEIFYLGLIFTEILTNAVKYGFENTEIPTIQFRIRKDQYHNIIEIEDNGCGFDSSKWQNSPPASGFDVIKILIEQIDGEITSSSASTTKFEITVPIS